LNKGIVFIYVFQITKKIIKIIKIIKILFLAKLLFFLTNPFFYLQINKDNEKE